MFPRLNEVCKLAEIEGNWLIIRGSTDPTAGQVVKVEIGRRISTDDVDCEMAGVYIYMIS